MYFLKLSCIVCFLGVFVQESSTFDWLSVKNEFAQLFGSSPVTPSPKPVQPINLTGNDLSGEDTSNEASREEIPETYCYHDIGCIYTTEDFYDSIRRPLNVKPDSREDIQVFYNITSPEDPKGVVVHGLHVEMAKMSSFNSSRKTKVIVHGFTSSSHKANIQEIPVAFGRHYNVNAVTVDWSAGAAGPDYAQAVSNTRVVGLEIAYFINWLRDNMGLNPADVHLIGHSLGAHVCGYAGEKIPGLGRITGLDPANPAYQYLPPIVRLDPTDAKLVDVIHTDSENAAKSGAGVRQPSGHLDFFPNDGKQQPGCQDPLLTLFGGIGAPNVWSSFTGSVTCSHSRSVYLFADTVRATSCPYTAFQCPSYEEYMAGECVSCGNDGVGCASMGLHADKWPGIGSGQKFVKFYLSTSSEPQNFCTFHYQVEIQMATLPGRRKTRRGSLAITFHTEDGKDITFDLTSGGSQVFKSHGKYSFLMEDGNNLDGITKATVSWQMSNYRLGLWKTTLFLSRIDVRNIDTSGSRYHSGPSATTLSFCGKLGRPLLLKNEKPVKIKTSTVCK